MKYLALIILLGLSMPGCSRFTKTGRMDRAYYKQLNQAKVAREKRRKNLIQHQRAADAVATQHSTTGTKRPAPARKSVACWRGHPEPRRRRGTAQALAA